MSYVSGVGADPYQLNLLLGEMSGEDGLSEELALVSYLLIKCRY